MGLIEALLGTRQKLPTVLTDVTRMGGRKVCVAALSGDRAIRLAEPHPTEDWLEAVGGLAPGDVISVNWQPTRTFTRPHIEDGTWKPSSFRKGDALAYDRFIERLATSAFGSVKEAFGMPSTYSERGNPAFEPGTGQRSLATVEACGIRVYPQGNGIRIDFVDAEQEWSMVPVEDLMLRRHQTSCHECAGNLALRLSSNVSSEAALLRVGLGRPFQARSDLKACFLQVNHIFTVAGMSEHFV